MEMSPAGAFKLKFTETKEDNQLTVFIQLVVNFHKAIY